VTKEVAAEVRMNMVAHFDADVERFVLFPYVHQISVANAALVTDNVGMKSHDYTAVFDNVLKNFAKMVNADMSEGWPLANIDPVVGLLGGLLQNFALTPK